MFLVSERLLFGPVLSSLKPRPISYYAWKYRPRLFQPQSWKRLPNQSFWSLLDSTSLRLWGRLASDYPGCWNSVFVPQIMR